MSGDPEPELVDSVIEDARWKTAGLDALARDASRTTLEYLNLDPAAFRFCLLGCDDARIEALNRDFRGQRRPTNVLSWPSASRAPVTPGGDPPFPPGGDLGDIALAYETCRREAAGQGGTLSDHVSHLVVHGLLHLLGYDHTDDRNSERMEFLETEILATLGIKRPY
ncbi:MAG: rRNA maturation RNase YbeY [Rhodobacter sp.]|nr:rRNA maturation RNase YbeY [Rhodobacter sp.]MCY4169297.1 rRNA maturation RNase YbeY [Rhodobacter sp.]MCY4241224.1 rRNA maturation RNase YbeY [Rhodobacter sp.]